MISGVTLPERLSALTLFEHAVKENGTWIRVKNSPLSVKKDGFFEVVSIVTSKHRVFSMGVEMADEIEVEGGNEISNEEALERLQAQEASRG